MARKYNIILWTIIISVCDVTVVSEWVENGCGVWSVFAAVAFYTTAGVALWACIDDLIKRKTN